MLSIYSKSTRKIELSKETSFKDNSLREVQDLEKWVKEDPRILWLNEELLIIATEFSWRDKTNERLDLLALDKNGKLVIIELKIDDSGKDVTLQAVRYAAYCSTLKFEHIIELYQKEEQKKWITMSDEEVEEKIRWFITVKDFKFIDDKPRIMLVAKEFRIEVTASVLWLRDFNIDISCVKLTLYDIWNNNIWIVSNVIIPLPEAREYMVHKQEKEKEEKEILLQQKEYIDFFSEVKARFDNVAKNKFPSNLPTGERDYIIPTAIENVYFKWIFRSHQRRYFHIELCLENNDKALQEAITWLKSEFKNKINKPVHINLPVSLSNPIPKVYFAYPFDNKSNDVPLEFTDEEFKKWIVEQSDIFFWLVKPILDRFVK